jgi:AcrR family transcriptional regulator
MTARMRFLDKNSRGGRPPYWPTKTTRDTVETAIAAGVSTSEIAAVLGISRTTLHSHFADELKNGRARKLVQALRMLDRAAKRGSVAAMKYLVNVYSQQAPVRLGKKERMAREAEAALADSPWADIISRRMAEAGNGQ